jgi:hypothetical protein
MYRLVGVGLRRALWRFPQGLARQDNANDFRNISIALKQNHPNQLVGGGRV